MIRQRSVGNGFHEELTILNHDDKPVELMVRLEADCDFADLFEVKDALKKKGAYSRRLEDGRLVGEHLIWALAAHGREYKERRDAEAEYRMHR